jgi:SH3 domain-containing protein
MMSSTATGNSFSRLKGVFGIAICAVSLAAVYFGFGVGTEAPKKEANASAPVNAPETLSKPVQAMNLALGNMVVLARDLGFSIKTVKDAPHDGSKIALRIESHLQTLREIYRQESGKNPNLVGAIWLQFNISPSGEVSQVKEISSRLNDSEFTNAIVAEVAKWSFADIVSEKLTATCPLLFVHEGMDITTLVMWEKLLHDVSEKAAAKRPIATTAVKTEAIRAAKTTVGEFETKYQTVLRKEPNFTAAALATFNAGTRVTVLRKMGDWFEVRSSADGPTGFIRKEFVKPIDLAAK